jgi:hypothetical protein
VRKIRGYVSEGDLQRIRFSFARCRVADSGNPNMGVEEAVETFLEDYELERELRKKYDFEEDESLRYSLVDGAILEADEEV